MFLGKIGVEHRTQYKRKYNILLDAGQSEWSVVTEPMVYNR